MQVVSSIDELQKFLAASNVSLDKRLPSEQSDKGLSALQSVRIDSKPTPTLTLNPYRHLSSSSAAHPADR